MIKEYTVVEAKDLKKLIEEVNALIENGCQPLGGISTASTPLTREVTYLQSVIAS